MKLLIWLMFLSASLMATGEPVELDAGNGSDKGSWGEIDICPEESFARFAQVKYENPGHIDDTYINAVRLYCLNKKGQLVGEVISKEGEEGKWLDLEHCPNEGRINGYSMKVQENSFLGDSYAVMDILFQCEDGSLLHLTNSQTGDGSAYKEEIHKKKSDELIENDEGVVVAQRRADEVWGPWAFCEAKTFVCGVKTRVERHSYMRDDAGLTDLVLFCCDKS